MRRQIVQICWGNYIFQRQKQEQFIEFCRGHVTVANVENSVVVSVPVSIVCDTAALAVVGTIQVKMIIG